MLKLEEVCSTFEIMAKDPLPEDVTRAISAVLCTPEEQLEFAATDTDHTKAGAWCREMREYGLANDENVDRHMNCRGHRGEVRWHDTEGLGKLKCYAEGGGKIGGYTECATAETLGNDQKVAFH